MIIGLGYQAQVGKDTVGQILVEEHGFKRLAFADKLKKLAVGLDPIIGNGTRLANAVDVYGWEYVKQLFPESREFCQRLGQLCRKEFADGIWVNPVLDHVYGHSGDDFVVTDVRYRNEARLIKKTAEDLCIPVAIVHVERPGFDGANQHQSEVDMKSYFFDHTVRNDGTIDDLGHAVTVMLDKVRSDAVAAES